MSIQRDSRNKVNILLESGINDENILKNATKLNRATIYRLKRKFKIGESFDRKQQSDRPPIYSTTDRRRLSNLANYHPKYSCKRLETMARNRGSPPVSDTTIWRYLKGSGYFKLLPKPTPMLTPKQGKSGKMVQKVPKF